MIENSVYPDVLKKVLQACQEYVIGSCAVSHLHHVVGWAEQSLLSLEDKDLRRFLMQIEGELDHIRIMTNETDFEYHGVPEIENREEVLKIIEKIKNKLEKHD